MDCKKVGGLIQDLVDGELVSDDSDLVRKHVGSCSKCADELRSLRTLISTLNRMELAPVPVRLADRVIDRLRHAGRIVVPQSAAPGPFGRLFGWIPASYRVPVAAAILVLFAVAIIPAAVGVFEGFVGKGTVLVTDTYLEVQDRVAAVDILSRLIENLEKDLRMLKTILLAGFSLLAQAGTMLMIPALLSILVLSVGVLLFLRVSHKRSAQHATMFSF